MQTLRDQSGRKMTHGRRRWLLVCLVVSASAGSLRAAEIAVRPFDMSLPAAGQVRSERVLPKEVAGVQTDHLALSGPVRHEERLGDEHDTAYLFISGNATVTAGGRTEQVVPESIVVPYAAASLTIEVPAGAQLHLLRVRKLHSPQDRQDLAEFPRENRARMYFTRFSDCEAYTEAIKSPKTVSRTVLPKDHSPRLAMGTVETHGPDKVGAHEHAMLDQLFLGLANNDVIVHADEHQVRFREFSLLHIPLGSSHWVEAQDDCHMHYLWMDFFLTKEGQAWLETHKPVQPDGS